ncbi:HD domain-containing protein [Methanosarcina sp. KYL-1]|uniref:HD domain-containing protein n=1 Tax=Methanosarcina sp. KYL-1 TaxID=2602068 RepID=UPI002100BCB0|nr:HD domain-containing protein [Methanosarcina sp. KYL-1]MCQ1535709.1 HD domain-containing protein [Methanosarcina sp. KYL-1]
MCPIDNPGWENNSRVRENFVPEPLPLEALYYKYSIERSHADNVARNALELFDLLAPVHGLDEKYRQLMEIAALVHDTGVSTDLEKHHKAGRDILFRHPPAELPERLRPVVAWTAFLHRKKAGEDKLEKLRKTSFAEMPEEIQDIALKVAALLRLADALDYSRLESRLGSSRFGKKVVVFKIKGPGAAIDAERMAKKGDLWDLLFDTKLEFSPESKK